MAPEYAGLMNALANTLGNYCGFITAAMAGFLLDRFDDNEKAWNYIFIITGGIAFTFGESLQFELGPSYLGNLYDINYISGPIYSLFVQTTRFDWTLPTDSTTEEPKTAMEKDNMLEK